MQINRLFGIIYVLLNKNTVTAKELSERFEVSQRTIYRDVETLSLAGIPIYMSKGKGGGIGLLPEFVLNKTMLSSNEKNEILSALQGLNAVEGISVTNTLSKLSSLFGNSQTKSWVEIDYSDWSNTRREQFELIKRSIIDKALITFDYYNRNGQSMNRKVEPITLWFKEKTWYLKAFCIERQDFRVFKLTRIKNVVGTDEHFTQRGEFEILDSYEPPIPTTKIVVKIDSSQSYRVFDDFCEEDIAINEDGSFNVTMNYIEDEWIYGYLLSFGSHAEVLTPLWVREIVKKRLKKSLERYS